MPDRVLVTGGTGKTGRLHAELLAERGIERRIATRRLSSADQIRFDWDDATTHAPALNGVTSIYLVAPTDRMDHLPVIRPFLEQAVARLPGRVVLLSASSLDEGGPMMGAVHAWLHVHAPRWTVLRPSWFMQNFTTQHLPSIINEESAIIRRFQRLSACGSSSVRLSFVYSQWLSCPLDVWPVGLWTYPPTVLPEKRVTLS